MIEDTGRGAVAIEKAVALFLATVADAGATPLSALANKAGLPNSTAQRMIGVFLRAGLLSRVGRGRYAAGLRLVELAPAADFRSVLVQASRDLMRRLAQDLGGAVHLGVLEGEMVTYLVKEQGGGPGVLTSEMIQLEAYCSGIGKVLLAGLEAPALEAYLSAGPFVALTDNTITDPAALRLELQRVRAQGHAYDDAELQDGLYCLAVPVLGPGGELIAALSASRTNDGWREPSHLDAMNACARRIAARLGTRPRRPA